MTGQEQELFETDMTLMVYAYTVIKDRTKGDLVELSDLKELKKIRNIIRGRIIEAQPTDGSKLTSLSEEELSYFIEDWADLWIQRSDSVATHVGWDTLDDDLT